MGNYWLIPMDFEKCDFGHLLEEYERDKEILWQAPPEKISSDIAVHSKATGTIAKRIQDKDIVYFYVTNLPDFNNERISRILLRGIIKNNPYVEYKNKVWPDAPAKVKVNAFIIEDLTTLKDYQLKDNWVLRFKSEINPQSNKRELYIYTDENTKINFIYPQGWTKWPDKIYNHNFNEDLIARLNEYFDGSKNFKALTDHFSKTCYFCGKIFHNKIWGEEEHQTFKGRNGLNYYEYHHFILQKLAEIDPAIEKIVASPSNGLCLCSNCHNRFHYGTIKDIKEMIDIVLNDPTVLDKNTQTIIKNIIGDDNTDLSLWLLNAYTSNETENKSKNQE